MEAAMMEQYKDLPVIPFDEITEATNTFHQDNYLGDGAFGEVYKGELSRFNERGMVAFKRLNRQYGQGEAEFLKEISTLSQYKHKNLITLLGYSIQQKERILVYEFAANRSLDLHIGSRDLTWTQRLKICLQAAEGLRYLHDIPNGAHHKVVHLDIKSANILLDEEWNAKIADVGLSKIIPVNVNPVTGVRGTPGYTDPQFDKTSTLTDKLDVYSFGVTLFEVLCGSLCYEITGQNSIRVFVLKWKKSYHDKKLEEIIFKELRNEQMDPSSLKLFSDIAYQCLEESQEKRPTMAEVVSQLEVALEAQERFDVILRTSLPEEYVEIVWELVPAYSSLEQLKDLLFQGILINEGKAWIQLINGKHYEMISMAACLHESEPPRFSKSKSRFTLGSYVPPAPGMKTTFMTRIKPLILSPNTTYIMNLVYRKEKPGVLYNGLQYKFKKETYYSFLSDDREDGWSTAELFQFTTHQRTTVDELEITFEIENFKVIAIEGIEFQPLDVKVEHGVLVDNQMDTQASDTNWGEPLPSMDNNERFPIRVALKSVIWRWEYLPETSFEELGQPPLSKFRISCNIESKILSRDTTYAGYLVYKQIASNIDQPAPAQVQDRNLEEMLDIYLQIPQTPVLIIGEVCEDTRKPSHRPNIKGIPQLRRDGCMEVQIWEFKTNGNPANIPIDLVLSSHDKRSLKGLEAKGIEFRPICKN